VRYHTYEVLKQEINNPAIRWAYLPYSMHMAGPREAIQHMIIRKNYGEAGNCCYFGLLFQGSGLLYRSFTKTHRCAGARARPACW
jgi:hypothetical protein